MILGLKVRVPPDTDNNSILIRSANSHLLKFKIVNDILNLVSHTCNVAPNPLLAKVQPSKENISNYGVIDIETYNLPVDAKTTLFAPYAVGIYYNNVFKSFYLTDFASENQMFISVLEYIYKNKIKLLWAHNGGRFDFKLLLKDLDKDESVDITKSFVKGTTIYNMNLKYKNHIVKFQDSYLLIKGSLRNLCKDFEVETDKQYFPYDFVNQGNLEYVGPKPSKD
jgi:hypothetical protein